MIKYNLDKKLKLKKKKKKNFFILFTINSILLLIKFTIN